MKRKFTFQHCLLVVLVVSASIFMHGCQTYNRVGAETVTKPNPDGSTYMDVLLTNDPALLKRLEIVKIDTTLAGDILRPTVTLRNLKKPPLNVDVKFAWYDRNGVEIRPDSQSWKPISFIGYETKSVQEAAPHAGAKSFKIAFQQK